MIFLGQRTDKLLNSIKEILEESQVPWEDKESILKFWSSWREYCTIMHEEKSGLEEKCSCEECKLTGRLKHLNPELLLQVERVLKSIETSWMKKYGEINVTPYIHIVICHTIPILDRYGSLSR